MIIIFYNIAFSLLEMYITFILKEIEMKRKGGQIRNFRMAPQFLPALFAGPLLAETDRLSRELPLNSYPDAGSFPFFPEDINHLYVMVAASVFLIIFLFLIIVVINGIRFRGEVKKRELAEKRYRKQLFSLAERFRITLNSIGDGVIAVDTKGRVSLMNPAASELTGYSSEEAFGKKLNDIFKPSDPVSGKELELPFLNAAGDDGKCEFSHVLLNAANGVRYHISCSAAPILDDGGTAAGFVLALRNITGECEQRERVETSLKTLQHIARKVSLTYFDCALDGSDYHSFSEHGNWGWMDGKPLRGGEWVYPEDLADFRSKWEQLFSGKQQEITIEYRSDKDGPMRYFRMSAQIWELPGEEKKRIFGIVQDITKINESERKYNDSNLLLKTLIETLPCLVFIKDASDDFRYLVANRTFAGFLNHAPEEMIGKTDREIFGAQHEYVDRFRKDDENAVRAGKTVESLETVRLPDGGTRYLHGIKGVVKQADGHSLLVGMAVDVTELEEAKQREAEARRFLQAILDSVPVGIFIKDPADDYRYLVWNKAMLERVGVSSHQVLGRNDFDFEIFPGRSASLREMDEQVVRSGEEAIYMEDLPTRAGGQYVSQTHKIPFSLDSGKTFLLGLSVDLSKEWLLEKKQQALIERLNAHIRNEKMLNSCLRIITVENDFDQVINAILKRIGENRNADRCYICRYISESQRADNSYEWVRDGVVSQRNMLQDVDVSGFTKVLAQVMERQEVVYDCSVENAEIRAEIRREFGDVVDMKALLLCPMWDNDGFRGILGLDFVREDHVITEEDREIVRNACNLFMLAQERKRQMETVEESILLRRQIVDNIVIPIAMFDREYNIITVNTAAAKTVNAAVADLIGKKCYRTLCESEEPPPWCPLKKVYTDRKAVQGEFERGDGRRYHFSTQPILDSHDEVQYIFEAAIDMTSHYRQQAALEASRNELQETNEKLTAYIEQDKTVTACLERLLFDSDFHKALIQVIGRIGRQLGASTCTVFQSFDNEERFVSVETWGDREGLADKRRIKEILRTETPEMFRVLIRDGFLSQSRDFVPGTPLEREFAGYLERRGANSVICAGIYYQGKYWGHIGAECSTPGKTFSTVEERMIRAAARMVEVLIERDGVQQLLVRSEAEKKMIFSMLDIPLTLLDSEGKVLRVNPAAEKLAGKPEAELLSLPCYRAFGSDKNVPGDCCVIDTLESGCPVRTNKVLRDRTYQLSTRPFFENGKITYVLLSFVDMTDVYLQQEQLKQAMIDAQAADRAKSFFLATMSHEIRTPLNAVIGFSELLQNETLSVEEQMEYLRSINFAGTALLHLINDILDLSKIEAGQIRIVPVKMDFVSLCREIQAIFIQKTTEKHLEFNVEPSEKLPLLYLDNQRMRQVLLNLVGNAIKFTEKGSVGVETVFSKTDDQFGTLTIRVRDTGIGMSEEFLTRIFQPFVQDDNARDRLYQGTGLGLSISYRLIRRMGGVLNVESVQGKGSCFTIVLDHIRYEDDVPVKSVNAHPALEEHISAKILIVDDVALNLKVLDAMLKHQGFDSMAANSGAEALKILRNFTPSLIFTDMWMPEMNGAVLAAEIRKDPRLRDCIVIALTADAEVENTYSLNDFDAVLLKPVSLEKLEKLLALTADRANFKRGADGKPRVF